MSQVAVVLFPGSNREIEAVRACKRAKLNVEIFRWNDTGSKLKNFDAFIIPGGFSYEDRGRSGIVASKDPILKVIKEQAEAGKPVLGICNGAQILVETGMVPGLNTGNLDMALAWNERIKDGKILGTGFYNDWVYMRHNSKPGRSVFNRFSPKTIMRIIVAHGEGRYTTREKNLLENLIKNEQTLFRYCNEQGKFIDTFPINPNGAMYNLAGVCNPQGNVLALMPHPEDCWSGQPIFDSLADYLKKPKLIPVQKKPAPKIKPIVEKIESLKEKPDFTILVKLIITDNEEQTLQNTLKTMGHKDLQLERQIYLGFYLKNKTNIKLAAEKIIRSGEILNLNKETPTIFIGKKIYNFSKEKGLQEANNLPSKAFNFFVTEYDNYSGKSIQANLKQHLEGNSLKKVERGVFWSIQLENPQKIQEVISTHIFHNPQSMKMVTL